MLNQENPNRMRGQTNGYYGLCPYCLSAPELIRTETKSWLRCDQCGIKWLEDDKVNWVYGYHPASESREVFLEAWSQNEDLLSKSPVAAEPLAKSYMRVISDVASEAKRVMKFRQEKVVKEIEHDLPQRVLDALEKHGYKVVRAHPPTPMTNSRQS